MSVHVLACFVAFSAGREGESATGCGEKKEEAFTLSSITRTSFSFFLVIPETVGRM